MEHQTAVKSNQADSQNQASCCAKSDVSPPESIQIWRELHRRIGSQAVGRQIQAKLKISEPGDVHEQEADQIADQVMRMPDPSVAERRTINGGASVPEIRRLCDECEEEKAMRMTAHGEEEEKETIQTKRAPGDAGLAATVATAGLGSGQPLGASALNFFQPRFSHDLSQVRIHTDARAADSARSVNALAYTIGRDVVFGAGQYAPETADGKRLLAHELTHVLQNDSRPQPNQTSVTESSSGVAGKIETQVESMISRVPTYPDASCDRVQTSINRAWPTSKRWVQLANRRLGEPSGVASGLQTHFKLNHADASQAADLATVRQVFARMEEIFDMDVANRCVPENVGGVCAAPDGSRYAAYAYSGRPDRGITHCLPSPDVGFLAQEDLVETLVHEVAHTADPSSGDFAYRHQPVRTSYANMTRAQAIRNADSYSEFAKDLYFGGSLTPLLFSLSTGALLSSGSPRWVIGATVGGRSRTGVEVFDLVGGFHFFLALDPAAGPTEPTVRDIGGEFNFGLMSRSPDTHMFVDTRLGLFATADLGIREPSRAGISSSTVIGWADSRFRAGVNLRLLYDFLSSNHAVIIGGEFSFGP